MSSIICPQCNNQIDDGFDFCPFCGQKVFKAQKNEDETRLIATGSVVWDLEMNKKFQNIHWVASGLKKKYVIAQIISLLFFIYPGLIYALTFWITRSLLIKKIYKNDLANNGGKPRTMNFEFYDTYFRYSDDHATTKEEYQNMKVIANKDGCITFLNNSLTAGYCIPLDKVSNSNHLINVVSKYSNYKNYNE